MKINENRYKIDFFRIHSVLNVDFDESYAFFHRFVWFFTDFKGFSMILEVFLMDLGWDIKGKSMKINENQ